MCRPPGIKVKVVGKFHVPSTRNPGKSMPANGTAEHACTFCPLRMFHRSIFLTPEGLYEHPKAGRFSP